MKISRRYDVRAGAGTSKSVNENRPQRHVNRENEAAETGSRFMTKTSVRTLFRTITAGMLAAFLLFICTFPAAAAVNTPELSAKTGAVIDAGTGQLLFGKDADTPYYPASITKLMTALIVYERCGMDDIVTFSEDAVTGLESGAVTMKLAPGDQLTVRDCLYALLLLSANEVANGLAEHVAGSVPAFAELMNQKAAQLGCTHTHFVNPNGLTDSKHTVSAHDMALIGRAFYANSELTAISSAASYKTGPTAGYPDGYSLTQKHKMLISGSNYYRYALGGKTGYTSAAGNTLVTCAQKDGVKLIAVVMKSNQTHYQDTRALFDYGFAVMAERGTSAASSGKASPVSSGAAASGPAVIGFGAPPASGRTGILRGPGVVQR